MSNIPDFMNDDIKSSIGALISEFSGLLAFNAIKSVSWSGARDGVLSTTPSDGLQIDLTDNIWKLNGILAHKYVPYGGTAIVENVLTLAITEQISGSPDYILGNLRGWINKVSIHGPSVYDVVDSISFSGTDGSLSKIAGSELYTLFVGSELSQSYSLESGSAIYVSGGGGDTFYGGESADALIGSWGADTFVGKGGDDWFFGGLGSNIFWGGDYGMLVGGGSDSVNYGIETGPVHIIYGGWSPGTLTVSAANGADTLYAIEDVYFEGGKITFSASGHIVGGTNLTIHNENAGNLTGQIVNLASMAGGIVLDLRNPLHSTIQDKVTGGLITLEGFHTEIIGSKYDDDLFDGSDSDKVISAGDGSDYVSVAGTTASAVIFGGDGADIIVGGDGADYIVDLDTKASGTRSVGAEFPFPPSQVVGSVSGGGGNDTIVVGYVLSDQNGMYSYKLDPGLGNDLVDIANGEGNFSYNYHAGDGSDIVKMHSSSTLEYNSQYDAMRPETENSKQPYIYLNLSEYTSSDVSVSFVRTSARIISEDLPNLDFLPIWEMTGDIVVTLSDGGQIIFRDVLVYHPSSDYGTYDSPPDDFSDLDLTSSSGIGSSVSLGLMRVRAIPLVITTSDNASIEMIELDGTVSGRSYGDIDAESQLSQNIAETEIETEENQDVSLSVGGSIYTGGNGVDRLTVTWDLNSIVTSLVQDTLVISDKWNLIGTTTLVDFDEVYVVANDRTYSVADFDILIKSYAVGLNVQGTDGDDQLLGSGSRDTLLGYEGDDTLTGLGGDDTLIGGAGSDILIGGDGDDTYIVDDFDDVVVEFADQGTDTVQAYVDFTLGDDQENLTLLGNAAIGFGNSLDNIVTGAAGVASNLSGGAGNDTLYGGAGADTLDGGDGNDDLFAGEGDDVLNGGDGNDYLVAGNGVNLLDGGEGYDVAMFSGYSGEYLLSRDHDGTSYVAGFDDAGNLSNVEALFFSGDQTTILVSDIPFTGTEEDDLIYGTSRWDYLQGFGGNDTIYGYGGADYILGGDGSDVLFGGLDDDYIDPGSGNDLINGGDGWDIVAYFGSATDYIIQTDEDGRTSVQNVLSGEIDVLERVETIQFQDDSRNFDLSIGGADIDGTTAADNIVGTEADETIRGFSGDDTISGGGGLDYIYGGSGDDTVKVVGTRDDYTIGIGVDGIVTIDGENNPLYMSGVEHVIFEGDLQSLNIVDLTPAGSAGADILTGTVWSDILTGAGGNDTMYGLEGSDWLLGDAGADLMVGGQGDDYYEVDDPSDVVVELLDEGFDAIGSKISLTLPDNVEDIVMFGNGSTTATGNALSNGLWGDDFDNHFVGLSGDDMFRGLGGDDILDGGEGIDTVCYMGNDSGYSFARQEDGTVNVTSFDYPTGNDTLIGIEQVYFEGSDSLVYLADLAPEMSLLSREAGSSNGYIAYDSNAASRPLAAVENAALSLSSAMSVFGMSSSSEFDGTGRDFRTIEAMHIAASRFAA